MAEERELVMVPVRGKPREPEIETEQELREDDDPPELKPIPRRWLVNNT